MTKVICYKIKELRKKNGLSQATVAEAINISQNSYSLLESGKTKIDVERLIILAKLYNISVDYFFTPPQTNEK